MLSKQIVVVEPGANIESGHYREKLSLWESGFRLSGWSVFVACLEKPDPDFLPEAGFRPLSWFQTGLGRLLPGPLKTSWLLFCAYCLAFRFAKQIAAPVLGLTTTTVLPVVMARLWTRAASVPFAQILMYGNSFDQKTPKPKRVLTRIGLDVLLRSGAIIFPNTERTRQSLVSQTQEVGLQDHIITLYDPAFIPEKRLSISEKQRKEILLISGTDDARRSPLFHLRHAQLPDPPDTIWIHAPGKAEQDILRKSGPEMGASLKVFATYRTVEAFAELFASATWSLVAYNPAFLQGSGLLAQSLAGGTPVLCSRFSHAEELFARFGKLGELFSFGDIDDFQKAWLRLRHWTSAEWQEFEQASSRFIEVVNAESTIGKVIPYFSKVVI
jgi:hypothetical protein